MTCLNIYRGFIEKNCTNTISPDDSNEILGRLILDALFILLSSSSNANVFRESGGAKCIQEMVKYKHCREEVLGISRELILTSGGDDDMLFILTTMHSASANNIELKVQILKTLLGCLRDSHRTRTIFRKVNKFEIIFLYINNEFRIFQVGGFVYVTSVFVSLDGKLNDIIEQDIQDTNCMIKTNIKNLLQLLHIVCQTLTTAMRFEPANAKYFHQEICCTSLCDTLKLLGCFTTNTELIANNNCSGNLNDHLTYYHSLFTSNILETEYVFSYID